MLQLPWLWPLLLFLVTLTVTLLYLSKPKYNSSPSIAQTSLFAFLRNQHRFLEWLTEVLSSSPSHTVKIAVVPEGILGIVTSNPANVEHVLKTNFDNYPKGQRFRFLLHDFLGRGIFNADGELWKIQRKAAIYEVAQEFCGGDGAVGDSDSPNGCASQCKETRGACGSAGYSAVVDVKCQAWLEPAEI